MKDIQFYDQSNIDTLIWPNTKEGALAKSFLLPLIKEGPEAFIQNAKTKLCVLALDDLIIPLTVNESEYNNCYLLSSYFIVHQLKDKFQNSSFLLKLLLKPLIALLSKILKLFKINKVVIINNWLMTTNLYPDLTDSQIKSITHCLKKKFPDHYYMFRSVNTYKNATTYNALNLEKFRLIPCRNVFLYDPSKENQLTQHQLRKQKKDTNKLKNKKYEVELAHSLSDAEITHLLHLYQNIYMDKYTKYSPLYTEKYLKNAVENGSIQLKLLKKEGKIYGVTGFLQKNGYILVPFFGYDTSVPQEEGLYRMLSSVIIDEINRVKLISHQGSGAGQFKKWRGFFEHLEYVAIFDHHLPLFRRLFWAASQKLTPLFFKK